MSTALTDISLPKRKMFETPEEHHALIQVCFTNVIGLLSLIGHYGETCINNIVKPGFSFTKETIKTATDNIDMFASFRIFFDHIEADEYKHKLSEIISLTLFREHVNLAMNRLYSQQHLSNYLGYVTSEYTTESPNIGFYCQTLMKSCGKFVKVHLYFPIGLAFDSWAQPDYQKYKECIEQDDYTLRNYSPIIEFYIKMWKKMVVAAVELKTQDQIDVIHMCNVGGNAFAAKLFDTTMSMRQKLFFDLIFTPAFIGSGLEQILLDAGIIINGYDKTGFTSTYRIPDNVADDKNNTRTLYIIAGDPHTYLGNEHRLGSIEGAVGFSTPCGLIGNLMLNPYSVFVEVDKFQGSVVDSNLTHSICCELLEKKLEQFPNALMLPNIIKVNREFNTLVEWDMKRDFNPHEHFVYPHN